MDANTVRGIIDELKSKEQALRTKIEELKNPLAQAEEDLRCIMGTIAFYERTMPNVVSGDAAAKAAVSMTIIPNVKGMTQKKAVVALAKAYGGIIRARDAKRIMILQGVMRDTKNSTRMVHNAIIGSGRFDRISPGVFRLRIPNPPSGTAATAASLFSSPKPPLQ